MRHLLPRSEVGQEPLVHFQAPAQRGHFPEAGMGSPSLPRDAGAVVPLQRKIPPISFLEGIVGKEANKQ